jgi:ankyrin repeat protein
MSGIQGKLSLAVFSFIDASDDDGLRLLIETFRSKLNLNIEKGSYPDNYTPLLYCIEKDEPECFEVLLEEADLNYKIGGKEAVIIEAATYSNCIYLGRLIEMGANVNEILISSLSTPLTIAAWYTKPKNIELLLSNGANKWHKDDMDKTALDYAIGENCTKCIELLKNDVPLNNTSQIIELIKKIDILTETVAMLSNKLNKLCINEDT